MSSGYCETYIIVASLSFLLHPQAVIEERRGDLFSPGAEVRPTIYLF